MPEEKEYIMDKNGIKRRMRRSYKPKFKQQIVDLYNTSSYTRAELMNQYELTDSALNRWIRQSRNSDSLLLFDYTHWYNHERIHSALDCLSPIEYRRKIWKNSQC